MSKKYAGLRELIGRIVLTCTLGFLGGYLVTSAIIKANAAEMPAAEMEFVEHLVKRNVIFMARFHETKLVQIIVYSNKAGETPDWLSCDYIRDKAPETSVETIVFKDYTASRILKEESCIE